MKQDKLNFFYLFHTANDITGLVNTVTFTPNNQTECFVVTYEDDNIYETEEGRRLTIDTGNSGLSTEAPSSTNLLISESDRKLISQINMFVRICIWIDG